MADTINTAKPILEVKNLSVILQQKKGEKLLVDDVSFTLKQGECLGILGESGSGKSLTVKSILGLLDRSFKMEGQALFNGKDLLKESKENLRQMRGKNITMVLQNPMTCFDPLCRINDQITETFATHLNYSKDEIYKLAIEVLKRMLIHDPEEVMEKYPHQLSGGMLQRVMIGIAMALKPDLLVADEPTTAIDAITQFEILEEFMRIKNSKKTSMLFITHDLGAISRIADHIIVMNSGKIVDRGDFTHILNNATDPYTKLLIEKKTAVMKRYRDIIDKKIDETDKIDKNDKKAGVTA